MRAKLRLSAVKCTLLIASYFGLHNFTCITLLYQCAI